LQEIYHNKIKSFSLLELIFVLIILSIIISTTIPKQIDNNLYLAINKVKLYFQYTRYLAIKNDFFKDYKKFYTIKFQRCAKSVGGVYFIVYSDTNMKGYINKSETIKDPIDNKYLYSNYKCKKQKDTNDNILLTQKYGIKDIIVSCNKTSTIGQFSFDNYGNIYTKFASKYKYMRRNILKNDCKIKFIDNKNNTATLIISPTGLINIQNKKL
jgi:hypothetical protein